MSKILPDVFVAGLRSEAAEARNRMRFISHGPDHVDRQAINRVMDTVVSLIDSHEALRTDLTTATDEIDRLTAALAEAEAAIAEARMDGIEDMRQRCVQFCIDRAKRHTSTERGLAVLEIADHLQDV